MSASFDPDCPEPATWRKSCEHGVSWVWRKHYYPSRPLPRSGLLQNTHRLLFKACETTGTQCAPVFTQCGQRMQDSTQWWRRWGCFSWWPRRTRFGSRGEDHLMEQPEEGHYVMCPLGGLGWVRFPFQDAGDGGSCKLHRVHHLYCRAVDV